MKQINKEKYVVLPNDSELVQSLFIALQEVDRKELVKERKKKIEKIKNGKI
jgi:hypothetical protein